VLYLKRPGVKIYRSDALCRALEIQRLEGSRPEELWGLYVDKPDLIVSEVAVAVGALRFQLVVAERMVVGQRIESSNCEFPSRYCEGASHCCQGRCKDAYVCGKVCPRIMAFSG
jgi:hypothetical protein